MYVWTIFNWSLVSMFCKDLEVKLIIINFYKNNPKVWEIRKPVFFGVFYMKRSCFEKKLK